MTVSDFALQLKTETKKSHTAAENTKFIGSFLRGVVSEESYKQLVANFYFIYRAMEEEVDKLSEHPIVGKVHSKLLNRTEPLSRDLRYYYGPNWRALIAPSEACQRYVNRIREVAEDDPELLVGHHYTRYMGDLSGGQILKGIAEKAMDLKGGEGLYFYEFEGISDKKGLWYQFKGHRWIELDTPIQLRKNCKTDIYKLYRKRREINNINSNEKTKNIKN